MDSLPPGSLKKMKNVTQFVQQICYYLVAEYKLLLAAGFPPPAGARYGQAHGNGDEASLREVGSTKAALDALVEPTSRGDPRVAVALDLP